ncbi:plasma protease C1 inhibitor [Notolabrus celidotus]|uniref:plasma protease C1 inhibitor n=1 Tax=Notolabrus celidotus TaxID=1203425 RepID=UPI0014904EB8|nr:plasma protease C1 inhibitor [Notolabrus celidotus]
MYLPAILCFFFLLNFELSSCTKLQVTSGSTLELPCFSLLTDFTGAPVTWKFNGEVIGQLTSQSPGSTTVKKKGMILSISPVTAAHSGTYECSVKENNVELSLTYDIIVVAANVYTIKIVEGQTANLPCHIPTSSQVTANALWFKETRDSQRTKLNLEDDPTDDEKRIEQLYPHDHDQAIILRNTVSTDTGIYYCVSTEGETLSTVYTFIQVAPTDVPYSCSSFNKPWEPCMDENSRTGGPVLQESMAEFSMKLYSYFRQSQPSSNLLFSPISVAGALSHLLLGARGDTRKAIERAMFLPHDFHCVHFQMRKLKEKLAGSLQMASQIYYNSKMTLSESFTNQSVQFYEAEPARLLETNENNTQMINSWVANKTNNKITHLVDFVSPNTQLMLLNAVSFSGQWTVKFDQKPKKGLFTKLDGDMVNVPLLYHMKYMMAMAHSDELGAQVARFALTGENSLYILLPRFSTAAGLQQVEEKMTDTAVRQMIEQMKTVSPQRVEVTLPQIKLDVQPDMNILIKKLGLSSLFEDANLCGLNPEERLVLDDARHRAFLTLTEHGVEAGAVTSMSFSRSFPSFSALRPFIMLLWSDQANVPLFIGRVTEP